VGPRGLVGVPPPGGAPPAGGGGRPPPRPGGGGGGGGSPLCIGKQEVGTYIYSRSCTVHGALGRLL
jgi:hypothetical protein